MQADLPRIVIGAVSSGSGKTTVTCGILSALKKRGVEVSAFKCGPDYIDPMFHEKILGIPSKNLDSFFCEDELLKGLFYKQAVNSEVSVIEGVMGYYDGIAMDNTEASTYHLAKLIKAPAVLVINAKGMALTAVAVIKGIIGYKNDSNIKAVILNNVSKSVYTMLKPLIESELNIKALGYLPHNEDCRLESRHLGLTTPGEVVGLNEKLDKLGELAEECIDIDGLLALAKDCDKLDIQPLSTPYIHKLVKIGVAYDEAFCFYYKDNIELLEAMGCELEYFSPIKDKCLPSDIDGLILGGGYPELYCRELSDNKEMLANIRQQLENGLPCLAECGGFMYLHKTIEDKTHNTYNMVGLIDGSAFYTGKLTRFGYINLSPHEESRLYGIGSVKAHEFHYWDSSDNGAVFTAEKPSGKRSWECMHRYKNVLCGYPHIFYYSNTEFARHFVASCAEYKEKK